MKSVFYFIACTIPIFILIIILRENTPILNGDEVHSIIYATNNRLDYEHLIHLEKIDLTAGEISDDLTKQDNFSFTEVFLSTISKDMHPPLYYLLLHLLNSFVGNIIVAEYILLFCVLLGVVFIMKLLELNRTETILLLFIIPSILPVMLEIRPYFLLFLIGFSTYFHFIKNKDDFTITHSLISGSLCFIGLLTNHYFIFFMLALFFSHTAFIIRNKLFIIIVLLTFISIQSWIYFNTNVIMNQVEFFQVDIFNRTINFIIAWVGVFFPLWSFKLSSAEYSSGILVISVLLIIINYRLVKWSILKINIHFRFLFIYSLILMLLYFFGITPHYAVGGKYFILLSIPIVFLYAPLLKRNKIRFSILVLSISLVFIGEIYFRTNEYFSIRKILNDKSNIIIDKPDIFTNLRIILKLDSKINVSNELKENGKIGDKRLLLSKNKNSEKFIRSLNTQKFHCDSLKLMNYNYSIFYIQSK